MKHPVNGSSRGVMSPRFLRGAAAGIAALMLAASVQPAAAQFRAPDIAVDEGEVAVFSVTLPKTYGFAVRFKYKTQDVTARKGRHYVAKEGHLVFSPGTKSAKVEAQTRVDQDAVTRKFKLALTDKQVFRDGSWSAAWAVIYVPNVPESRTIYAKINNTVSGSSSPSSPICSPRVAALGLC